MKAWLVNFTTRVYEVVEEAFFRLSFFMLLICVLVVAMLLGAYVHQYTNNWMAFYLILAFLLFLLIGPVEIPRAWDFIISAYHDKDNRKILKNSFAVLIMFQIYLLAGQELGESIVFSLENDIIDISFIFTFIERLLEGLAG